MPDDGFGGAPPPVSGGGKAPIPVQTPRERSGFAKLIGPVFDTLARLGYPVPPPFQATSTAYVDPTSPEGAARVYKARANYITGQASVDDMNVLLAANEISPADLRAYLRDGGTGGGGSGLTAYEAAQLDMARQQFEYQKQQDRVASALSALKALSDEAAARDARQQAAQQLVASVAPYAIDPSMQFFAGLAPTDAAVRLGLASPLRTNPVTVRPAAVLANPYDAQVQEALAQFKGLAGIA
ncbi:MAG TPA: hypothetical protein VFC53_01475 [Dehalococcoidia bacterium]|nr:hypothetical protein [Dehalococcoidia bacterium]